MNEESENAPAPGLRRLTPYTPPARALPPVDQKPAAPPPLPVVRAPAIPVPRPVVAPPVRPAPRPVREIRPAEDGESKPHGEFIETTRLTSPPASVGHGPSTTSGSLSDELLLDPAPMEPDARRISEAAIEGFEIRPPAPPPLPGPPVLPPASAPPQSPGATVAHPPALPAPQAEANVPKTSEVAVAEVQRPAAAPPAAVAPREAASAKDVGTSSASSSGSRVRAGDGHIGPAQSAARVIKNENLVERAPLNITPTENPVLPEASQDVLVSQPSLDESGDDLVMTSSMSSEPAAPKAMGELPWWIRAISSPALVRVKDRWLSTAERFAAEHAVGAVADAVGAVLGQRIIWEWAGGSIDAEGQAFGVVLGLGAGGEDEFMISVDGALARAIVNKVTAQFAQLRGAGDSISDAEAGVLEFVTLTVADRIAESAQAPVGNGTQATGVVVKQFLNGAEAVAWGSRSALGGLAVQAAVGPMAGVARIWLGRSIAKSVLQQIKRTPPLPAGASSVVVSLQLPGIALTESEWNSLSPGDVLLIGATRLAGPTPRWRLVTENGWSLCEAECIADTPTLIAAQCSGLAVAIDPVTKSGAEGKRILRAMIGRASLATSRLANWPVGLRVELAKEDRLPVELWCGLERVGRGEIVDHQGEKAVHVVEWSALKS